MKLRKLINKDCYSKTKIERYNKINISSLSSSLHLLREGKLNYKIYINLKMSTSSALHFTESDCKYIKGRGHTVYTDREQLDMEEASLYLLNEQ